MSGHGPLPLNGGCLCGGLDHGHRLGAAHARTPGCCGCDHVVIRCILKHYVFPEILTKTLVSSFSVDMSSTFLRGLGVQGLGFGVQAAGKPIFPSAFSLQPSAFGVQGSGFGLLASRFSLQPSAFSLQPSGFRVQGSGFRQADFPFSLQPSAFSLRGSGFRSKHAFSENRTLKTAWRRAFCKSPVLGFEFLGVLQVSSGESSLV